jgi:hypothetical protein
MPGLAGWPALPGASQHQASQLIDLRPLTGTWPALSAKRGRTTSWQGVDLLLDRLRGCAAHASAVSGRWSEHLIAAVC